jgi:PTS system nitrogen regulatory IIA component
MVGTDVLRRTAGEFSAAPVSSKVADIITPHCILSNLGVGSKKAVLSCLARHAAEISGLTQDEIYRALIVREKMGSTGVGAGVGIPHARLSGLDTLVVIFARLARPIDFDSVDDQPVDLLFLLLSPEREVALHLKALSKISRLLHDPVLCRSLRQAEGRDGLGAVLVDKLST